MLTETDGLKIRMRAASKYITKHIGYKKKGTGLYLGPNQITELLDILNPTKEIIITDFSL